MTFPTAQVNLLACFVFPHRPFILITLCAKLIALRFEHSGRSEDFFRGGTTSKKFLEVVEL